MTTSKQAPGASVSGGPAGGGGGGDECHAALLRWLELHAPLLKAVLRKRPSGERLELFPSPSLAPFASGLATLLDDGAVITIDYGADAATLIHAARRVQPALASAASARAATRSASAGARSFAGLRVRSRLPAAPGLGATLLFTRPGWSDLTTDVNFTHLAALGKAKGLCTAFFGPQTALQRGAYNYSEGVVGSDGRLVELPPPPPVTDASPPLRRGVLDAFYSLGSFVMLVQATPEVASRWQWRTAGQPLFGSGQPSLGAMALVHALRTLGRLTLEHALQLQATLHRVPTERELAGALADALLPSVPCFRAHWRAMAVEVLRVLHECGSAPASPSGELSLIDDAAKAALPAPTALPPLYRPALALVREDLELLVGPCATASAASSPSPAGSGVH